MKIKFKMLALFLMLCSFSVKAYVVAIDANYPPFSLYDYTKEEASGLDIDILKEIAKRENLEFEFKPLLWSEWRESLADGRADIWAGGIAILPERTEYTYFSESYMPYGTGIISRKGENLDLDNLSTYRLAAVEGTSDFSYIEKINEENAKGYKTLYLAMKSLASNEVDAVVGNYAVGSYHTKHHPDFFEIEPIYELNHTEQLLGFMISKNTDETLLQKINQGLNAMLEDGTIATLEHKWLNKN